MYTQYAPTFDGEDLASASQHLFTGSAYSAKDVALSCSVSRPVTTNESRQPPASLSYLFHTGHANKIAYRRVINNSLGRQSEEVRRQGQEDLTVLRHLVAMETPQINVRSVYMICLELSCTHIICLDMS